MPQFEQKAPQIMRLLMTDFALSEESAAAILGNVGHECAGFTALQEIKPVVKGSRGGWGWCQWTASRRVAMEAYCERNNLDPASDKANYGWLFVELKGEEKRAIPAVQLAEGLDAKVIAFCDTFLRPGVKHYPSRQKYARRALAAFRAAPQPSRPIPGPRHQSPEQSGAQVALGILAALGAIGSFVAFWRKWKD